MSIYEQQELIKSTELSEESLVNPTRSQVIEKAVKTIAHYTPTIYDCFAKLSQDGQWWKTSQDYSQLTLDGLPETYSKPLPKQGMMLGGKLYHAPSLGELISENGCLLQRSDGKGKVASSKYQVASKNNCSLLLERSDTCHLKLLPTPKHTDKNTAGVKSHKKGQQKHLSIEIRKLLRKNGFPTQGYLDACFVEEMMGFPRYWSDRDLSSKNIGKPILLTIDYNLERIHMALMPKNTQVNKTRLGQLGNAIVPQVAAVMFDVLAEKFKNKVTKEARLDIVADKLFPKVAHAHQESDNQKESTIVDGNLGDLSKLNNYKEIIKTGAEGLKSFEEIGTALIEIRDRSLYKLEGYKSFIVFCWDNFELSKARIYQLIDATNLIVELKKSTNLDGNLSGLSESHCRELRKIKDPKERTNVLKKVASAGTITAKAIASTYKHMHLEAVNQKQKPTLPRVKQVVRIVNKFCITNKQIKGYWGVVTTCHDFSVDIRTLGCDLTNVHPQDFICLKDADSESAIALLERLEKLYNHPLLNDTASSVLKAIISRPYPLLEEADECLLSCLEKFVTSC